MKCVDSQTNMSLTLFHEDMGLVAGITLVLVADVLMD
jgi:hypothetical protein